jgi:cation transport ATPase
LWPRRSLILRPLARNSSISRWFALQLALSDKTFRIINQNMLCGFFFIAFAIVLSGVGLILPIAAAFIHEFGAFFVIFNSARLLRFKGKSA